MNSLLATTFDFQVELPDGVVPGEWGEAEMSRGSAYPNVERRWVLIGLRARRSERGLVEERGLGEILESGVSSGGEGANGASSPVGGGGDGDVAATHGEVEERGSSGSAPVEVISALEPEATGAELREFMGGSKGQDVEAVRWVLGIDFGACG